MYDGSDADGTNLLGQKLIAHRLKERLKLIESQDKEEEEEEVHESNSSFISQIRLGNNSFDSFKTIAEEGGNRSDYGRNGKEGRGGSRRPGRGRGRYSRRRNESPSGSISSSRKDELNRRKSQMYGDVFSTSMNGSQHVHSSSSFSSDGCQSSHSSIEMDLSRGRGQGNRRIMNSLNECKLLTRCVSSIESRPSSNIQNNSSVNFVKDASTPKSSLSNFNTSTSSTDNFERSFIPSSRKPQINSPHIQKNLTLKSPKSNSYDDFFSSDDENTHFPPKKKTSQRMKNSDKFFSSSENDHCRLPSSKVSQTNKNSDEFFPSSENEKRHFLPPTKTSKIVDDFDDFFPSSEEEVLPRSLEKIELNQEQFISDHGSNFVESGEFDDFFPSEEDEGCDRSESEVKSSVLSESQGSNVIEISCRGYVLRTFNPKNNVEKEAHFTLEEQEDMSKKIARKKSHKKEVISTEGSDSQFEDLTTEARNLTEGTYIKKSRDYLPYAKEISHLNNGELFQGKDSILLEGRNSFGGIATAMVAILNSSQRFGRILDGIYGSIIRGNHLTRGRRDVYRRDFDTLVRDRIKPRILPDLYSIHFIPVHDRGSIKENFYVVEVFVDKRVFSDHSVLYEVDKEGVFIWKNNSIQKL